MFESDLISFHNHFSDYFVKTGYVPSHHFGFGTTYKEGTERAVAKFKRKDDQRKSEILDLNAKAAMAPPLKLSATYPPPDVSHPGTNLRYATAYYGKKFCEYGLPLFA